MQLEELKNRAIRGVVALTGRSFIVAVVNFLSFNLLAAILGVTNIGIYVAVTALRDIFNLFIDVGLGAALIQKKGEVSKEELSTIFLIQELMVTVVVAAGFFLTPLVVSSLHLDSPAKILYWALLATLLINSFKVIPSILLERKLMFERQVFPQLVEVLLFNDVAIILAWRGFGLLSYSYAIITSALGGLILYYIVSPYKPIFKFSKESARQLVSFGLQFQGKSYLAVVKDQLLTLFLIQAIGFKGLGLWSFGQRWAYSPFRFIVDSITKVTFPAYSRIQHDNNALSKGIEKSIFAVTLLLLPSLVFIALFGRSFVILTPSLNQYASALPTLYILCIQAMISAWSNILVNALDATGHVKTTLALMVFWTISTWFLTIVFVAKFGVTGIALAALLVSLTIVVTIFLVKRFIKFSFLKSVIKPLFAGFAMVLTLLLSMVFPLSYLSMILSAIACGLVYLIVILVLARKELLTDLKIVLNTYQK